MKDKSNYCLYHHPTCNAGCTKVQCRGFFPLRAPIIMESQLAQCESLEHRECEQFKSGNVFQEERRAAHKGCEFLSNAECGHPERFRCNGSVPPFIIEKDNFLSACFESGFKECPNYKTGVKFREESNRIKSSRT